MSARARRTQHRRRGAGAAAAALAALAVALLTLLALAAVPAGAARPNSQPVFFVESTDLHVSEEWRQQDPGHPRRCATWVLAEGRSNLGVAQHAPRKLTLAPTFGGGFVGTLGGSDSAASELRRTARYRHHLRPDVEGCSPCGPLSEYGQCTGGRPDVVDSAKCSPGRGQGLVTLWLTGGTLTVSGHPRLERELEGCREIDDAPTGVMGWAIETVRFPGALSVLRRLPIGGRHTFRSEKTRSVRGGCRRLGGVGFRSCVAATAVVVVHRVR